MNDYNVLATIDLTKYRSVPELYNDLLLLKKDEYENNDRIVFVHGQSSKILKLVEELLDVIDIPKFFVIYNQVDCNEGLDFEFSQSHCIYPWIGMAIGTIGDMRACCESKEIIANIADTSINDVYHGTILKELRKDLLAGNKPDNCTSCWHNEANGFVSMRQSAKYKFKDIYYKIDYQKENFDNLQTFDLKLGNACNLACKICNRRSSSKIAEKDYNNGIISLVEFNNLKNSTLWAKSEDFWEQLLPTIKNLKYLDLFGGEPLMSKMHFDLLKKLIDVGVSHDIKIDYNTNGTVFSEKFFDIWQHFKEVKLSFSIDDIEHRFEEQRSGAIWSSVCENIKKYNSRRNKKFITEVYSTVNTQNVFYIPELLEWYSEQSFDHIYFNLLSYPMKYNIISLDKSTKQKIITKLTPYQHHSICQQIIKLLES